MLKAEPFYWALSFPSGYLKFGAEKPSLILAHRQHFPVLPLPPTQPNSSSGNSFAAVIALAIATTLVLLFTLDSQHIPPAKIAQKETKSSANIESSTIPSQQLQASDLAESKFADGRTTKINQIFDLLKNWKETSDTDQNEAYASKLSLLLESENLSEIVPTLAPDFLNFALGLPDFQVWIKSNPSAALVLFSIQSDISEPHIRTALTAWRQTDYNACIAYIQNLPAGPWREQTLALACQYSLSENPAEAADWAKLLAPGPRQTGLFQQIALSWASRDTEAAAQWIGRIPDEATRTQVEAVLIAPCAETDPEKAARWLLQSVRPGEFRDQVMSNIAVAWAATDPSLISSWVEKFPAGEARQTALRALVNLWANHDRAAVQAWVAQLPSGAEREEAEAHLESLPVLTAGR